MIPPASFAVRQLVYTNVEAVHSPTRQGGFQVWRYSAALASADHRKAVARRLGDFKLPPAVKPDPAAIQRFQAFAVPGVGYVIARAVPLPDKDQFGRGGRFLAHALVLSDEQFAAIGYDPFRVLGADPSSDASGFAYLTHPRELLPADGGRPEAMLPDAVVAPADYPAPSRPLAEDMWHKMLVHLVGFQAQTVVVPDHPDTVLAVARAVVRALPPEARKRFAFDTLSSGATLAHEPYALVGGYSMDSLRLWSFRKYHALDLKAKDFRPPLPKAGTLPGTLLVAQGWDSLADDEREVVFETATSLAANDTTKLGRAEGLTPAAAAVLVAVGGRELADKLWKAKVALEVPVPFAARPAVAARLGEYRATEFPAAVARLADQIPREVVNSGLVKDLTRIGGDRPVQPLLDELDRWLKSGDAPDPLRIVAARWRLGDADYHLLERLIRSHRDERMAKWVLGTLPFTLDEVLVATQFGKRVKEEDLTKMRLWLSGYDDRAAEAWGRAWLQVASLIDQQALHDAYDELTETPSGRETADLWWFEVMTGELFARSTPGWAIDKESRLIGLFVSPPFDPPAGLVELDLKKGSSGSGARIVDWWRGKHGVAVNPPDECGIKPGSDVPKLCEKLLENEASNLPRKSLALAERLRSATFSDRKWALWELHMKAKDEPRVLTLDSGQLFAGVRVMPARKTLQDGYLHLFEALARQTGNSRTASTPSPAAVDLQADPQSRKAATVVFWEIYDALTL